ncbi:NADH dehydrogenase (ubiquinone) complex I, assembly factor 6-like [Dendronephthya gigantea]|uniref:NADH dehydrogenase (ubiquinone) complex I, assembly factor 6-like n=1 Tax=Dendronephthya gigantea TaxID=151771 RepID=UPI00106CE148|nr:NADH dehydrogenase (ubiquinone) complex I, assembly factor 6-like [Dendronephthya gigantea]XP_028392336.1 NADH dehydrogenase (ubiquinone) complex I, assembly factor 6-like [Dendronephthya gigantea]
MLTRCSLSSLDRKIYLFNLPRRHVKASRKLAASATGYCVNLVRQYDFENYLCCLLVNKQRRPAIFAIRAFNVEIAKICDSTTVETIGKMKIQFWRDTLDSIFTKGNCPDHPVSKMLQNAVEDYNLSKHWFTRILDGREENLHDNPFSNIEDLENYAEKTISSILYLTLEGLGVKDTNADHCASHLGKAIGIVTLLRSTLYHAKSRRVLWPSDVLIQQQLSQEDVLRGKNLPAIKEATYQLASRAHVHLNKARALSSGVPKLGFRSFLPAVSCNSFLESLQQADFEIFDSKLQQRNNLLPILLLRAMWRGTF